MRPVGDAAVIADGGLQVDVDGRVLTVTLAKPDSRNSQTPATWRALVEVADNLPSDIQIVVLRGAGQSFSAGLDRKMFAEGVPGQPSLASMADLSKDDFSAAVEQFQRGFTVWREVSPVVIAAVQGYAIGAGFQLALGADIIVAADDVQFSMKETQLGLVPDLGGTGPLINAVGYSRALEICATGRFIGAAEAVALGFATRQVPAGELDQAVADLIASLETAPGNAVADLKRVLRGAELRTRDEQREVERVVQYDRITELAAFFKQ